MALLGINIVADRHHRLPPLRAGVSLIALSLVASGLGASPAPAATSAEGVWTRTNTRPGASARDRISMTYDALRAGMPPTFPPLRAGGAMAYDDARRETAFVATDDEQVDPNALWTRYGAGWLRDFALADLDADASNELVIGGFGVGALDERSLVNGRYRWMNKWPDQPDPAEGDDNELAYDIDTDDVTGDGVPDTLAGTSMGLMGFDGRDGHVLYRIPNEGTFDDVWELGTGDFNDDGVKDVVYSYLSDVNVFAADGRDGSILWRAARTAPFAAQIDTADLNDDGATDVLVIGSGGFGSNIDAFSGLGAAQTGTALPLWSRPFRGGDPAVFRIGQVVAGGPKEIVVGGYLGQIEVLNSTTGATLASWDVEKATDIELVQMDDDDDLEIAIATGFNDDNGESTTLHAFDSLGQSLWDFQATMPPTALDTVDLDDDGSAELVVGGGFYEFRGRNERDGFVAALDPRVETEGGTPPVLWETTAPTRVGFVGHGGIHGQPTILVGEDVDPYVRGLSYDGTERFVFRLGGHPRDVAAADIDGDGRPEILEGATDAEVAVHDRHGNTLWHARFPGKATPDIEAVHAGELTDDPGSEVIAGSFDFGRGEGGQVRVFTSDGRPLWSDITPGPVGTILATDLDDDGAGDLLVANSGPGLDGLGARLARYAGDGTARWKTDTPPGISGPPIGTLEVNGDGVEDVILLTLPFGHSFVLAYDGATGAELWRFAPRSIGQWLDVRDDLDDGITFGDIQGRIFRLRVATGEPVWERKVDGASRDGTWTVDANGDGIRDVATGGDSGIVHLLSGADGSDLWTQTLDGEERGLRVASISGTETTHIAVGSYTNTNGARSGVYFFEPLSGTRVARFETEGHVLDIEPVDVNGDGNQEAVTAAGLQIHAINLNSSGPGPDPTPTPTPSPSESQPEATTVAFTDRSAESGQYSDDTRFEARLGDSNGDPISGADLTLELTGAESSRTFTAVTDDDGMAVVTPRLEEKPGPYQLTVRYAGSAEHEPSSNTTTFVVDKEDSGLELIVEGKGSNRTLTARLSDRDSPSAAVAGRTIDFYADGGLIGSATTDENGVATLRPPPRYRGGKHDFEARFEGDGHYLASSDRKQS